MGNKLKKKLFVLTGIFLITCVFVYNIKTTGQINKPSIKQHFEHIDNYKLIQQINLDSDALNMLDLDDYVYAAYEGPKGKVNLFIGYYYSANKAYASHSPLVCYPSQGWEIIGKSTKHSVEVGSHSINYEEIITSLGNEKELVLYWYQAGDRTNTQIYQNKIDMGYNKILKKSEEHAFLRISTSMTNSNYNEARTVIINFVKDFYPHFIDFIDS